MAVVQAGVPKEAPIVITQVRSVMVTRRAGSRGVDSGHVLVKALGLSSRPGLLCGWLLLFQRSVEHQGAIHHVSDHNVSSQRVLNLNAHSREAQHPSSLLVAHMHSMHSTGGVTDTVRHSVASAFRMCHARYPLVQSQGLTASLSCG